MSDLSTNISENTEIKITEDQVSQLQQMIFDVFSEYAKKRPPTDDELCEKILTLLEKRIDLSLEKKLEVKDLMLSALNNNADNMVRSALEDRTTTSMIDSGTLVNTETTDATPEESTAMITLILRATLAIAAGGAAMWFGGPLCAHAARWVYMTGYGALFGTPSWTSLGYWATYVPGIEWAANIGFTWGHGSATFIASAAGAASKEIVHALLSGTGFVVRNTANGLQYIVSSAAEAAAGVPGKLFPAPTYDTASTSITLSDVSEGYEVSLMSNDILLSVTNPFVTPPMLFKCTEKDQIKFYLYGLSEDKKISVTELKGVDRLKELDFDGSEKILVSLDNENMAIYKAIEEKKAHMPQKNEIEEEWMLVNDKKVQKTESATTTENKEEEETPSPANNAPIQVPEQISASTSTWFSPITDFFTGKSKEPASIEKTVTPVEPSASPIAASWWPPFRRFFDIEKNPVQNSPKDLAEKPQANFSPRFDDATKAKPGYQALDLDTQPTNPRVQPQNRARSKSVNDLKRPVQKPKK